MKYERVTGRDHLGQSFAVDLEVTAESGTFLEGWEVNRDGSRLARLHLIDRATVERRTPLTMNRHYGVLEVERVASSAKPAR